MLIVAGTMPYTDGNKYKNRAIIVKNGKKISYSKRHQGESGHKPNTADFHPGKKPGIFYVDGLKCGIEIAPTMAVKL